MTTGKLIRLHIPVILLCLLLSGCALWRFRHVEPPMVSLVDLQLKDATIFEQIFTIRLRIQNPNSFAIPIEGAFFSLDIQGEPFAEGVAEKSVEAPPMGSCIMELEAVSTTLSLVRQLNKLHIDKMSTVLPYRVRGIMQAMGKKKLPFDYVGEIDLAGVLDRL